MNSMQKTPHKTIHKTIGTFGHKFLNSVSKISIIAFSIMPNLAHASKLTWSGGSGPVEDWFNTILLVLMGVFVMTACIMGSLAFKQLAADGNWKDFWSKIAGAIGMFVVPTVIYWVKTES